MLHTSGASYPSNYSATIPAILIASVNAWVLWKEHWDHFAHLPPLEERTEYAYQNIRTKNFFWGDGDKWPVDSLVSQIHTINLLHEHIKFASDSIKAGMMMSTIIRKINVNR
ncbi:hypothetical protein Golomagni_05356, partial [Golovinomyces magnicellulatus]